MNGQTQNVEPLVELEEPSSPQPDPPAAIPVNPGTQAPTDFSELLLRRLRDAPDGGAGLPFLPLVSLLEETARAEVQVGGSGPHDREGVRFCHDPSLAFSAADVSAVRVPPSGPVEVQSTFLGLTGTASPLPGYIVEEVLQEDDEGRQRAFLDLFHHRILSVLVRASRVADPARAMDDASSASLVAMLLSYSGLDIETLRHAGFSHEECMRLLAPALGGAGTSDALSVALHVAVEPLAPSARVRVSAMSGGHSQVHPSQRTRLGLNTRLGDAGLPLGTSIADPASGFDIHLGPLEQNAIDALVTGEGNARRRILATVEAFVPTPLDVGLVLEPAAGVHQLCRLSRTDGSTLGGTARLGVTGQRPIRLPLVRH